MTGYLIDPTENTVTEIEVEPGIEAIYEATDCRTFSVARLPEGDGIYIDDEGLLNGTGQRDGFFESEEYPQPCAGKGLILGSDAKGDSTDPARDLEHYRDTISFPSLVDIRQRYGAG